MPIRWDLIAEAGRQAEWRVTEVVRSLVNARRNAGLSQAAVAAAIDVSRPLIAAWEAGRVVPTPIQFGRWGAAVGLDVSLRAFPGGQPLRDAGQLRLLERFRAQIGDGWTWRTEVPASTDPSDRRAIDAVLSRSASRVGIEAVTRLLDAQGQVRPILLKQGASGIATFVLLLAESRLNREAAAAGAATIGPAFPCSARVALGALRGGEPPPANAVVFA